MRTETPTPVRRKLQIWRFLRGRRRLVLAVALGLLTNVLLPGEWRLATRMCVGWDLGIAVFLALTWRVFLLAQPGDIRRRARSEDEGRILILVLTAAAAMASLGAIVSELSTPAGRQSWLLTVLLLTIVLSWFLIHTIFALHYAHEYYDRGGSGLAFPATPQPDYWDFVYFSFVIGMTAQVSDVTVTDAQIRRTVIAHGIIAFFFNTALLALAIGMAGNAIAGH